MFSYIFRNKFCKSRYKFVFHGDFSESPIFSSKIENNKLFYDVIYNPRETNFLKKAKTLGNRTENGKKMFIHQAAQSFKIWHGIQPEINEEVENLLD